MKALHRVVKNTLALSATELFSKVTNFVFVAVLARYLTTDDFGAFTTITTLIWLVGPLADAGVSQILVREIAAGSAEAEAAGANVAKNEKLLSNGLIITTGLALVACVGMAFWAAGANYPANLRLWVAVSGLAVLGVTLTQTSGAVLRGIERMEIQAFINSGVLLAASLAGIGLAIAHSTLPIQIMLLIGSALAGAAITLQIVNANFTRLRWHFDPKLCRALLAQALPIAALGAYQVFLRWVSILILGQMRPMSEVAIYGAANKILDIAMVLSTSGVLALFPVMAARWRESESAAQAVYIQAMRVFIAFGAGMAVGMVVLAKPLVVLIFGESYQAAAGPLALLGLGYLLLAASSPMGMLLMADSSNRLRRFLPLLGSVVLGNIFLNIWLAPRYSYVGSALAFTVTGVMMYGVSACVTRACFATPVRLAPLFVRPLVASAVMGIFLWLLQPVHLLIRIPIGGIVFTGILLLLGEGKQEPYRAMLTSIRRIVIQTFTRQGKT